jgi:hypothetical protein
VITMTVNKLKRYEMLVYLFLISIAVILAFIGNGVPAGTINSILVNVSSELIAAGFLFFLVNRFLLVDEGAGELEEIRASLDVIRGDAERLRRRQFRQVRVLLQCGVRTVELPVVLSLAEFSRAEVLGRVGMIPMKRSGARFVLAYFNSEPFLRQVSQILSSDEGGDELLLTIPCSEEEIEQFAIGVRS